MSKTIKHFSTCVLQDRKPTKQPIIQIPSGNFMNINAIHHLSTNVQSQITANNDVVNFICSSAYFVDLFEALYKFLPMSVVQPTGRILKQSYVKEYTQPPEHCMKWQGVYVPTLIFAPLTAGGDAFPHSRIAHLPLLPNRNSVSVYFPSSIITDDVLIPSTNITRDGRFRIEPCPFSGNRYDFAIPIVLNDFIDNPANFLDMGKIIKQINGI